MGYITENYIEEYIDAYGVILKNAMEDTTLGVNTPLEKLFTLIDDSSGDTTVIERLSMKKDAYMQILGSLSAQSQATAVQLVDKKYGFDKELALKDKELELAEQKVLAEKLKNGLQPDETIDYTKSSGYSQAGVLRTQQELYERQTDSFDDNKFQKVFEAQVKYNSMIFQDADEPSIPESVTSVAVNDIYNKIIGNDDSLNSKPEA